MPNLRDLRSSVCCCGCWEASLLLRLDPVLPAAHIRLTRGDARHCLSDEHANVNVAILGLSGGAFCALSQATNVGWCWPVSIMWAHVLRIFCTQGNLVRALLHVLTSITHKKLSLFQNMSLTPRFTRPHNAPPWKNQRLTKLGIMFIATTLCRRDRDKSTP